MNKLSRKNIDGCKKNNAFLILITSPAFLLNFFCCFVKNEEFIFSRVISHDGDSNFFPGL